MHFTSVRGACAKLPRHIIAKFSPPDLGGFALLQVFGSEAHFYNDMTQAGAALTRRAAADREVEVILAAADRDSNRLRGDGEAQAIAILAESLNKDPEFFSFRRSLDAYKEFLNQETTVILSSESEIFKYLQSPGQGSSETTETR